MRAIKCSAIALVAVLALSGCAAATAKAPEPNASATTTPSATPSASASATPSPSVKPAVEATPQQIAEALIYYHCEVGTGPITVTPIIGATDQYSVVVKEKLKDAASASGFAHATWLLKVDPVLGRYELSQNGDPNWSRYACGVVPISQPEIVVDATELKQDLIHDPL